MANIQFNTDLLSHKCINAIAQAIAVEIGEFPEAVNGPGGCSLTEEDYAAVLRELNGIYITLTSSRNCV